MFPMSRRPCVEQACGSLKRAISSHFCPAAPGFGTSGTPNRYHTRVFRDFGNRLRDIRNGFRDIGNKSSGLQERDLRDIRNKSPGYQERIELLSSCSEIDFRPILASNSLTLDSINSLNQIAGSIAQETKRRRPSGRPLPFADPASLRATRNRQRLRRAPRCFAPSGDEPSLSACGDLDGSEGMTGPDSPKEWRKERPKRTPGLRQAMQFCMRVGAYFEEAFVLSNSLPGSNRTRTEISRETCFQCMH